MLESGDRAAAVAYASEHFASFGNDTDAGNGNGNGNGNGAGQVPEGRHFAEIKQLMGALAYFNKLKTSHYAPLFDTVKWAEATELFIKDNAALLGLPVEEPLLVCINAGCAALPKLMKVVSVLQADQQTSGNSAGASAGTGLWSRDELPIEIELGPDRLYHSVFACPVSRETATKTNPPMRLLCGHAICKESLQKIAATSHIRDPTGRFSRFKCTYCPSEQSLDETRPLFF